MPATTSLIPESAPTDAPAYSTGILPSHELEHQVRVTKEIFALEPIEDSQFQPASLDLRLGPVA